MNLKKTVIETIKEHIPCPVCGNRNIKNFEIKFARIGNQKIEMRIICKDIIEGKGHCGTDISFETDRNIKEPLYGGIIPIPSPSDIKIGILFLKQE